MIISVSIIRNPFVGFSVLGAKVRRWVSPYWLVRRYFLSRGTEMTVKDVRLYRYTHHSAWVTFMPECFQPVLFGFWWVSMTMRPLR